MNDVEEILLAALREIAGEKGDQRGVPLSPQPCDRCSHPDCRAARALFEWNRRRSIDAIGRSR